MEERILPEEHFWETIGPETLFVGSYHKVSQDYIGEFFKGKTGSVIDMGCGPGRKSFISEYPGLDYTGVDHSLNFITYCRENWPEATFILSSIEKVDLPDKSFDYSFCSGVLEHLEYYEKAISEMVRLARKEILIFGWGTLQAKDIITRDAVCHNNYYGSDKLIDFLHSFPEVRLINESIVPDSGGRGDSSVLFIELK